MRFKKRSVKYFNILHKLTVTFNLNYILLSSLFNYLFKSANLPQALSDLKV